MNRILESILVSVILIAVVGVLSGSAFSLGTSDVAAQEDHGGEDHDDSDNGDSGGGGSDDHEGAAVVTDNSHNTEAEAHHHQDSGDLDRAGAEVVPDC